MNHALARRATLLLVTAADEKQAAAIARHLVGERLAACINTWPVRSVYRWLGKIHDERECLMLLKTRASLATRVERRIKELHSYEVPETIAFSPRAGSAPYLQWLLDSTAAPPRQRRKRTAHR